MLFDEFHMSNVITNRPIKNLTQLPKLKFAINFVQFSKIFLLRLFNKMFSNKLHLIYTYIVYTQIRYLNFFQG